MTSTGPSINVFVEVILGIVFLGFGESIALFTPESLNRSYEKGRCGSPTARASRSFYNKVMDKDIRMLTYRISGAGALLMAATLIAVLIYMVRLGGNVNGR